MGVRVAIAQINSTVGDIEGNAARIVQACEQAASMGARVVVTPELSLVGYPPEDLLLRDELYARCEDQLGQLARRLASYVGLHVVIGHPSREALGSGPVQRYNCASVLADGLVVATYRKHDLPNYEVFDEVRYFAPSSRPCVFEVDGVRFGLNICEDIWFAYAPDAAKKAGAQVLLVPNGSPYHLGKQHGRLEIARQRIRETGVPLVYANLVGGQDELQFDGSSFVLDAQGELRAQLPHCQEAVELVEFEPMNDGAVRVPSGSIAPTLSIEQAVYAVLVQGVRDYVDKNKFPGAIIGLSGGIDSALTLAITVDALGAARVRTVMMPSQYTADISWIDARDMAARLHVRYDEIAIRPIYDAFRAQLAPQFEGLAEDATEENIQARSRGTLLMALSNKTGWIVLTTGNKSELATGYCTLYGDMAGGFAVIKDIFKTLVYRLSRWRNTQGEVIPERIITRAPSAELRSNQTDQDSLPPYDVLDDILRSYMEEDESIDELLARGHDRATVERVIRLLRINEYKRRQAPVGVRVTHRAFGRDWRYPITNRFREAARTH
ncbi:MAG TPA: NAD+ synthase [Burkholderiaceae bacterium]|nr:NAD+ synthase [Burkholderiaceae bacterium]